MVGCLEYCEMQAIDVLNAQRGDWVLACSWLPSSNADRQKTRPKCPGFPLDFATYRWTALVCFYRDRATITQHYHSQPIFREMLAVIDVLRLPAWQQGGPEPPRGV